MSDDKILSISNYHAASCGTPPNLDGAGKLTCYFQNQYGEQWFIQFDYKSETFTINGGDIGWDTTISLTREDIDNGVLFMKCSLSRYEMDMVISFCSMCLLT